MTARLKRDVERRAFGFGAGLFESDDLGVIAARDSMVTGADDFAAAHQHCADHGIGTGSARGLLRQAAGQAQITPVLHAPNRLGQRR